MSLPPIIVWFREDLRLQDNPAFHHAVQCCKPIIALFIVATDSSLHLHGEAQKWWLQRSLKALNNDLKQCGGELIIQSGDYLTILCKIIQLSGSKDCTWNNIYTPFYRQCDDHISQSLFKTVNIHRFSSPTLCDPIRITTDKGTPFRVFTPFWNKAQKQASKRSASPLVTSLKNINFYQLSLKLQHEKHKGKNTQKDPDNDPIQKDSSWSNKFCAYWQPGRAGALQVLARLPEVLSDYNTLRNYPATNHTSQLSAHLRFGEISPQEIVAALSKMHHIDTSMKTTFIRQLAWRDFHIHLMYHFPHILKRDWKSIYETMPWRTSFEDIQAWKKGRTGYPLIDAGMRQLYACGWMHNRIRMVVASFFCKHLFIHWSHGALWFYDTLLDACPANNSAGWQWVAGSGADAAPYFRIFNPILQSKTFDPHGIYIKTWVKELADLPPEMIHDPWKQSTKTPTTIPQHPSLINYPQPIIALSYGRHRALNHYHTYISPKPTQSTT
ncbi:MAG: deoxyribodipyrimidine photo-lyase [Proteobacteria bacterium]|nr:deoxyribodipyrimidine photo-lyase [Pseudomonadota bacterium]